MTRRLRTRRDRGAVLPIVALLLPVLMVMTAFAVDLGRQRSSRRDMQAAADVIALDMSRLADGRVLSAIQTGDSLHPAAETALVQSANRNSVARSQLALTWGVFDEPTSTFTPVYDDSVPPDAARIVATESTDYYFQPGSGTVTREAIARYGAEPFAGFSVGSYGVAMSSADAQLLDDLLSPFVDDDNPVLQDDPVELDAASYQGLAGADIPLGDFAGEFGAATPRELLDMTVALDDFLLAAANILRNQGRVLEADLVEDSISAEMQDFTVDLGGLVSADSGAEDAAMDATVDLPSVIAAAVFQAQCDTNAQGFEQCDAISIPTLTTSLPLTSSSGWVKIIESPRYHYGPVGSGVNTGQIQVHLQGSIGATQVGTCTPSLLLGLNCLLNGLLVRAVDATVDFDITLTLAGGRTTIADIDCADPAALGLDLRSATGLYDADVDIRANFNYRNALGALLGSLSNTMALAATTGTPYSTDLVDFTVAPDVLGQTMKSTGGGDLGLAPMNLTTNGTHSGILSNLATLDIDYDLGGLLDLLVNPLLVELDQRVVSPLTNLLGLNVTGSDLVAQAIDCDPGFVELVK